MSIFDAVNIGNSDFTIQHSKGEYSPSITVNRHCHNRYELYLLLEGNVNYFIREKIYNLSEGDIAAIGIYDFHRTIYPNKKAPFERIAIHFDKDFLTGIDFDLAGINPLNIFETGQDVIQADADTRKRITRITERMLSMNEGNNRVGKYLLKLLLAELLIEVHLLMKDLKKNNPFSVTNEIKQKVTQIMKYINKNYSSKLSLAGIADEFYISRYYLTKVFKRYSGLTVVEYINNVRINESLKLLESSTDRVSQIASAVGFNSAVHFDRVFRSTMQTSPLKYRKLIETGTYSRTEL
ncbi:MAG: AraC family transcriptional regulator [bacterium]|jgi:AraC-like DNA-binding protein/quercetin dioxygenase-like cupin family protein|nr:AraC family transcriptional regulator [bacterium]